MTKTEFVQTVVNNVSGFINPNKYIPTIQASYDLIKSNQTEIMNAFDQMNGSTSLYKEFQKYSKMNSVDAMDVVTTLQWYFSSGAKNITGFYQNGTTNPALRFDEITRIRQLLKTL